MPVERRDAGDSTETCEELQDEDVGAGTAAVETCVAVMDDEASNFTNELKNCSSITKLLALLKRERQQMEDKVGKKRYELCVTTTRKCKRESVDFELRQKRKVLKQLRVLLLKHLGTDKCTGPAESPGDGTAPAQDDHMTNRKSCELFTVTKRGRIKQTIADVLRKPRGTSRLLKQLIHHKGRFQVDGQVFKMRTKTIKELRQKFANDRAGNVASVASIFKEVMSST